MKIATALVGGFTWYLRDGWGCISLLIRMQKKRVFIKEVLVNSGMLEVSSYTRGDFSLIILNSNAPFHSGY